MSRHLDRQSAQNTIVLSAFQFVIFRWHCWPDLPKQGVWGPEATTDDQYGNDEKSEKCRKCNEHNGSDNDGSHDAQQPASQAEHQSQQWK